MARQSKIHYNPNLSIEENAKRNGVTADGIRYHIQANAIDRRLENKIIIVENIRKCLSKSPDASIAQVTLQTGYDKNTVRKYWDIANGNVSVEILRSSGKKTTKKLRERNNFYATHPSCGTDILREETFNPNILEPFCGTGSLSEAIKSKGFSVESYDIVDRHYGKVGDFFQVDFPCGKYDIISNPPYSEDLAAIIKRCIHLCKNKVALLMPLRYLSGENRYTEIYQKYPPVRVYAYIERINIALNADFIKFKDPGANREMYAWFIWEKNYAGPSELRWIHNRLSY